MAYLISSTSEDLLAKAHLVTGIEEINDHAMISSLDRVLTALNTEAKLSETGATDMESRLLPLLANRIRMLRDFRENPEIEALNITKPIILKGAARTGSTKLHKMLAASGDFKYLPFWQGHSLSLRTGNRNEDPSPRIRDADYYTQWFDRKSPNAKLIHHYETYEPEEELIIYEHSAANPYMQAMVYSMGLRQTRRKPKLPEARVEISRLAISQ